MIKTTLKTILGLSLIAGCAGDDGEQMPVDDTQTERRQQSVRAADATAKLLSLSNASIGAASIGSRGNLVADLSGEIEAGVAEFLAEFESADCALFSAETNADNTVTVALDFDSCLDAAGDTLNGDFDITVALDGDEIDCDYDADIEIDGTSIEGNWTIDINDAGTAVVLGEVSLAFLDGATLSALIDASWKDLGGACPELEQHIEVTSDGASVSVDLGGLDLCSTSLCGSGIDIQISDAAGLAEVDFGASDISVEGLADGFVCDASGNLDWDSDYQDTVDEALDGNDPLEGQEIPGN